MPGLLTSGLATGSGGVVGVILGLVGGGGSILAVPLLTYVVGVSSPHVAIGTSALAVSVSAADGQSLLALFGVVMLVVGGLMLRKRRGEGDPEVRLTKASAPVLLPWLLGIGFAVGLFSGFFGIGGGFLIVPGLMLATSMPLPMAIGTSLVAVSAFGAATAASYAVSGLIDWPLAGLFVLGGVLGGLVGAGLGRRLSQHKRALTLTFAGLVILVGLYVVARGALPLLGATT
jgi:uncharacterized protein